MFQPHTNRLHFILSMVATGMLPQGGVRLREVRSGGGGTIMHRAGLEHTRDAPHGACVLVSKWRNVSI